MACAPVVSVILIVAVAGLMRWLTEPCSPQIKSMVCQIQTTQESNYSCRKVVKNMKTNKFIKKAPDSKLIYFLSSRREMVNVCCRSRVTTQRQVFVPYQQYTDWFKVKGEMYSPANVHAVCSIQTVQCYTRLLYKYAVAKTSIQVCRCENVTCLLLFFP